jgi:hypothetical protein
MKPVAAKREAYFSRFYAGEEPPSNEAIAKATADIEDLMGRLFAQGYTDMQVYRMLGLSSEADWQWLAEVKAELPALTPR